MMQYHLINDARARAVAKDITKIAKETGVKLSLTAAQRTTAEMFGYTGWSDMLASIGEAKGPEDHELAPEVLTLRKTSQTSALIRAGFQQDDAQRVLARLKPTGRTDKSIQTFERVHELEDIGDYHPNRFKYALSRLHNQVGGWSGYLYDADLKYQEWAQTRPLTSLDREVAGRDDPVESTYFGVDAVTETGHIVDVSAMAYELSEQDALSETWDNVPSDPQNPSAYFFHFGLHQFPSPFKDLGVDGCYVTIDNGSEATPDYIDFLFTVSDSFCRDSADVLYDQSAMQELRGALRSFSVGFSPVGGDVLSATLHSDNDNHSQAYRDAWRPYLPRVINAVWNALKLYRGRKCDMYEGYGDIEEEFAVKLKRASTETAILKALKAIAEEYDDLPVRFLGVPPVNSGYHSHYVNSPYPRLDSGHVYDVEHLEALLADAIDMERAWSLYYSAKEAIRIAELLGDEDYAAEGRLLRANALYMNAAVVLDQNCDQSANYVANSKHGDVADYLSGVVVHYMGLGDEKKAHHAQSRLEELRPDSLMTLWCAALLAVRFKTGNELAAVLKAAGKCPETANRMMKQEDMPWSWFWRTEGYVDAASESDHAACMIGKSFYLNDGRPVLAEVLKTLDELESPAFSVH